MSYGSETCPRCGGEIKVYTGGVGRCANCDYQYCMGTHDEAKEIAEQRAKEDAIREERMKHIVKIVVWCSEADDDRYREWSEEFTNKEDADAWARKQSGCVEYSYYDEKGRIE